MSFLNYLFDINKVSKPESVKNIKRNEINNLTILDPPSFTNIKPKQIITNENKILSYIPPEPIIQIEKKKVNVSNIQTISNQNNKILSNPTTTILKDTLKNTNIIIPQTAFNQITPYWANNKLEAEAPIDISNNIISLNNSSVIPGTYTVAEVTVDEKGIIQDISSGFIPPNDDWSFFPALGNVDMDNNLIKNLGEPVDNNDASTKNYVDTAIITLTNDISNNYVNLISDQDISGIKTFLNIPISATLPLNNNQVANKEYVDTQINNFIIDVSNGYVNLTTAQDISGIKTFLNTPVSATLPLNNNQVANKEYVDNAVSSIPINNYLPLAGGTMTGNIDMSGNDLINIGSLTAGGITESATFGQALFPMAGYNVYATNVSMNSYNPISAMNFIGVGGVNINAPDNDINLNAGDINLTQTQTTSFMNLTAAGAIVAAAGGAVDITAGGAVAINAGATIQILAPGNVSIGSGNVLGADTEIEKIGFSENTIYKAGLNDLELDNVAKLQNTGGTMLVNSSGNMTISSTGNISQNAVNMTMSSTGNISQNSIDMSLNATNNLSLTGSNNLSLTSNNASITSNTININGTGSVNIQSDLSGNAINLNTTNPNGNLILNIASGNVKIPTLDTATSNNILYYGSGGVITYGPVIYPLIITLSVSATAIDLSLNDNRTTYIFTTLSGGIQNFTTSNLTGIPAGYSVFLKNGLAAGVGDITIQINGSNVGTLYNLTATNNTSQAILYWTGTTLEGYF